VGLIVPFIITLIPLGMILREPDLGTSILLLPTLWVMLFLAGARLRHLLVIAALAMAVVFVPVPRGVDMDKFAAQRAHFDASGLGPVTFYSLHEPDSERLGDWLHLPEVPVAYCRFQIGAGRVYDLQPLSVRAMKEEQYKYKRVASWLRQHDPRTRKGIGYQQRQSMVVLGSGQLYGLGGWNRQNTYFDMLPEEQTDFIFSVIGGQWGFVGCVGVLILYGIIFVFGADIAISTDDPFGRLLAVGVLALLAAQIFINIGMTMGLMPVTGMTLPLISYGGSSLLINGIALGLLVNVGQNRPLSLAPKPFEYGSSRPESQSRISPSLRRR
jgi:rod shape determining protein RodA